jgi:hypothetical protein
VVVLIATIGLIGVWLTEGFWSFVVSFPSGLFITVLVALLYWLPRVEVDEGGVRIINIVRTHYISWGAIELIDTKYTLSLRALGKKYSAWGAPAPGRHSAIFASRDQGAHLPESSYLAGTVRPGDLINSDSGAPAAYIRRIWEQTRDQNLTASVASSLSKTKVLALVFSLALFLATL